MLKNLLLIFAHPYPKRSRINRILFEAVRHTPDLVIHDLYEQYPDFYIDVAHEQAALRKADVLILQHPFYWYSAPALLKLWFEEVLERDFAYGPDGTALHGKYWQQVISTGGPESAYQREGYNHFSMAELLRPFEQTAYLCGMTPLSPLIIHHATRLSEEQVALASKQYTDLISGLQRAQFSSVLDSRRDLAK